MPAESDFDETYMNRCLELARSGLGTTAPNPLVGALIVHDRKIIGEGFHRLYGGPHAEVYAINAVKDKSLLRDSTLYVNLEPCSHLGKTPPCTDLIIESKIPAVAIGTIDPNSLVKGKGIEKLKSAGVRIKNNILVTKCIELNKRFFTFYSLKRPYIILKWAQTKDSFIDIVREEGAPNRPFWISNELSRALVHKWRSEEKAILVGTNTARLDNPSLNVREWSGNNPLRIVIDRNLSLPGNLNLFDNTSDTLVINEKINSKKDRTEFLRVSFTNRVPDELMHLLFERGIQSLLIEGGKRLLETFIAEGLWDEARIFIGNMKFHRGVRAPDIEDIPESIVNIENDELVIYKNSQTFSCLMSLLNTSPNDQI